MEIAAKLSMHGDLESVDGTFYRQFVGSLFNLTILRHDIIYDKGTNFRFMTKPKVSHQRVVKGVICLSDVWISFWLYYGVFMHWV
jgi:hypothetical protein